MVRRPGHPARAPPSPGRATPRSSRFYDGPDVGRDAVVALQVMVFATIAFMWFVGVVRSRLGEREPRLVGTVFLGGAIILAGLMLVGAAVLAAPSVLVEAGGTADPGAASMSRALAVTLLSVFTPRVATLVMFSTAALARGTRALPRWLDRPDLRRRDLRVRERHGQHAGGLRLPRLDRARQRRAARAPAPAAGPRAVRAWLRALRPDRRTLGTDAVAGVPGAIGSVPDGMAAAVLVGVNPVYGLYASIAGPIAGGLTASTQRMVITTTTAAALAAGSAVSGFSGADRSDALFLLTILAGALMVAAGLLRLGRYTRFVSVSVLTGFLTGVAFNIIFGQLGDLLGAPAEGSVLAREGVGRRDAPGRDLLDVGGGRPLRARADDRAVAHAPGDVRLGHRADRPDAHLARPQRDRARRGRRRHPDGHPDAAPADALPAHVAEPARRRGGGRDHRARPGHRGGRERPEPGRLAHEPRPGLPGAGDRQHRRRALPRAARRRVGRAERAEHRRRCAQPLGGDLLRRSGCC